jgi:flagellar hook protein FlgE
MSMMGTAVSGMLADSNWLSTISQNVANANTTGYKNAETEFAAVVDQVGSATSAGGGVDTSLRSLNTLQGSVVGTTTSTDLAIQGDGYFVVSDSSGDTFLTRNGSFVPDAEGNLVNSAGYFLMGYNAQGTTTGASSNSTSGLQKVNVIAAGEADTPTTSGTLSVNVDADATIVAPADLPSANTSASTSTSETSLVTYDNLGGSQSVNVYYTKTGANTWQVDVYNAADATNGGFPYMSGGVADTPLASQTLTFDSTTGALTSSGSLTFTVPSGASATLDIGATTQLESAFAVNAANANGNPASALTGVSISPKGVLSFTYSTGETSPGYDIPLATVPSEDSLTSINGDAFETNENSGSIRLDAPGSGGMGSLVSSSLEDSTVDLATELTQMIEAQSSYQANSKAFQAGADILDVLNNLKA